MLYAVTGLAALGLLVLDQWVKYYITVTLPLGERMDWIPGLIELRTVHNYGAAWSSFSGQRYFLLAVTTLIVLAVVWVLARRIVRHPLGVTAAMLIVSGGIGNIIDRIRLGYVVDMFQLVFWRSYPVFNVADICVVCGAILASVYYLWLYERYDAPQKGETHGDSDAPTE